MVKPIKLDKFADPIDMWNMLEELKAKLDRGEMITALDWNIAALTTGASNEGSPFTQEAQ